MVDPPVDWPFADPPNVAVITVRSILDGRLPVLIVSHDADDGTWQFHSGGPVDADDGVVVGLGNIIALDQSLAELADLPVGAKAWRRAPGAEWTRAGGGVDAGRGAIGTCGATEWSWR